MSLKYRFLRHPPAGAPTPTHTCPGRSRRRGERGFSLLEVFIGIVVLGIAILIQAATTVSVHRLSSEERTRSEALHVVKQVIQRLRADEDWAGLYARLRTFRDGVAGGAASFDTVELSDGRTGYRPAAYFPDFVLTAPLDSCHILIDVPAAPLDAAPGGPLFLREDVVLPALGLPADLNGDGAITGDPLDVTYAVLPIELTLRWTPNGESSRELRMATWLRGDR